MDDVPLAAARRRPSFRRFAPSASLSRASLSRSLVLSLALLAGCGESPTTPAATEATDSTIAPAQRSIAAEDTGGAVVIALVDGDPLRVDGLGEDVLFVNYWAEWCGPCIEEIPELNRLHADSPGAQVLGVNFDGLPAAEQREQMQRLGIAFPVALVDPGPTLSVAVPEVLPSTYVLRGTPPVVTAVLRGPQTLESLEAAMASDPASDPASD